MKTAHLTSLTTTVSNTTQAPNLGQSSWPSSNSLRRIGSILTLIAILCLGNCQLFAQAASENAPFSTGTPESGIVGDTFTIVLPLENTGPDPASNVSNVNVTSASFGTAALTAPALPIPLGPWAAASPKQVVLQFSSHGLIIGGQYLLSLRGTYESGTTRSFAVSRIIEVTTADTSTASDLRLWAALDAIRDKAQAVDALGPPAAGKAMLSFLQSDPAFSDAGISPDSIAVWATLADGSRVAISFDSFALSDDLATTTSGLAPALRQPATSDEGQFASPEPTSQISTPALAATSTAEFPTSPTFRLLNAFPNFSDPILLPALTSWLSLQNYTPVSGATASVEGLKAINNKTNDGVFMIRTHGRIIGSGTMSSPQVFELWTADVATNLSKTLNYNDLHAKPARLDFFIAEIQKGVPEIHLAITPAFVTEYWKPGTFSQNSLVYIDACQSDVDPNWKAAIQKAGASVYAGWTGITGDPFAAKTARLVFDRMLGADRYCPETSPGSFSKCAVGRASGPIFPQRPFDYAAVWNTEYAMHGLGLSLAHNTVLNFTPPSPSGGFGLLAPSISNMVMNEGESVGSSPGDLTINGTFGSEEGSVMVGGETDNSSGIPTEKGGKEVQIKNWSATQIVVALPYSGLGSAGNVQVIARDHFSNVAQLTEWRDESGQFTFTLSGDDSLQELHTYKFHLRADIRKWRKVIHDPPSEPLTVFGSANDSSATVSLSGSAYGVFPGETFFWTGSKALTNAFPPELLDNLFFFSGGMPDSTHLAYGVGDLATHGGTCTKTWPDRPPQTSPLQTSGPSEWFSSWGISSFTMAELDDSGAIKGGSESGAGIGLSCERSFPSNGKGQLVWPTIAPQSGTAPDPNSAR